MKEVVFDLFEQDKMEALTQLPVLVEAMKESKQDQLPYIDFESLNRCFKALNSTKNLTEILNMLSIVNADDYYQIYIMRNGLSHLQVGSNNKSWEKYLEEEKTFMKNKFGGDINNIYFKDNIQNRPLKYKDLINYLKYLNQNINKTLNSIFE